MYCLEETPEDQRATAKAKAELKPLRSIHPAAFRVHSEKIAKLSLF